jgi:hypothetical protein
MTREQVVATVGAAPGDYTTGTVGLAARGLGWTRFDRWIANDGELLVLFDDDGRAVRVALWDVDVVDP